MDDLEKYVRQNLDRIYNKLDPEIRKAIEKIKDFNNSTFSQPDVIISDKGTEIRKEILDDLLDMS